MMSLSKNPQPLTKKVFFISD